MEKYSGRCKCEKITFKIKGEPKWKVNCNCNWCQTTSGGAFRSFVLFNEARKILNIGASDARAFMIRNSNWKYIYYKGFEPQLFDLKNDPQEFNDLGKSEKHSKIREEMKELLLKRIIDRKNRVAATDEFVTKERDYTKDDGIMIGVW